MPSAWNSSQPEQRVGDEEVADLVAAVVEDQRAPVRVRAAARVGVLVQRRAVEAGEREVVAREVRRHPVEDHADAVRVQAVDELAEVVGRAEARRRGEVARHLVAPRARERVRHHRQQLDVGEAHVLGVGASARRPARGRSASGCPRAGSAATSRGGPRRSTSGRRARELLRRSASHSASAHSCCGSCTTDGGLGRHLGLERDRVGLQADLAVRREDLVLVVRAGADAGQEQLPHARGADRAHRVDAPVPVVEVADDRDRARRRAPRRRTPCRGRRRPRARARRGAPTAPRGGPRRAGRRRARRSSAGSGTGRRS